jgi:hypothetical protein
VDDPIDQLPQTSGLPRSAPFTESFVDAINLPGGIFEKTPFLGFSIEMAGTCVFPLCCKAETHADNTTESEMDAANRVGKGHRWVRLYMEDLGLPFFKTPIPPAEDNTATRLIAHTGKITRDTRHIALKTLSLHKRSSGNEFLCSEQLAQRTITAIISTLRISPFQHSENIAPRC